MYSFIFGLNFNGYKITRCLHQNNLQIFSEAKKEVFMLLLLVKQESCADPPTKAGDNSKRELPTKSARFCKTGGKPPGSSAGYPLSDQLIA